MKYRSQIFQMIFITGLVLLAAWTWTSTHASQNPVPPAVEDAGLSAEGTWSLISISGEAIAAETRITLTIKDEEIGGFSGCNQYGGTIQRMPDDTVRMGEIAVTLMFCEGPAGVMEQEALYFSQLARAERLDVSPDGLRFFDAGGAEVLVFQAVLQADSEPENLENVVWELRTIGDKTVRQTEPPAQMLFENGDLAGYSGCRHFIGAYELDGDAIRITSLEMMPENCSDPERQDLENQFLSTTDLFERYRFADSQLEVILQTGQVLNFSTYEHAEGLETGLAEFLVRDFLDSLTSGEYRDAAELFAPTEEFVENVHYFNPDVLQESLPELLEAACTRQFFCMPVHEVVETWALSEQAVLVRVTFQDADGVPFRLGACCGGEEPPDTGPTVYSYLVKWTPAGYRVSGDLVYVP